MRDPLSIVQVVLLDSNRGLKSGAAQRYKCVLGPHRKMSDESYMPFGTNTTFLETVIYRMNYEFHFMVPVIWL